METNSSFGVSMAAPEFSPLCLSWIKPRVPTPPKALSLATIDTLARNMHYNRRVVFYECLSVDRLKASLSDVLVHFYPAAGRLVLDESGKFSIDCNDQGVEFVETTVAHVSMEEFRRDNFQMKPIFNRLVGWESNTPDEICRIPLLSIQVTHFGLGGAALGVAHSHLLADGHSLWHFMKSWAECCRGVPLSMPPIHDRTVLMVDKPSEELAHLNFEDVEEWKPLSGEQHEQQFVAQRVFRFSKDKIQSLKHEATRHGAELLTTYQVLCAHLWKSVTQASGNQDADTLNFISATNFRSRMKPPFPPEFFGNSVMWVVAQTSARELHKENLGEIATRIQASVLTCNHATVISFLHWLELHSVDELINRVRLNSFRMRVSSSPKFPVFEVDFGWGKPLAVRTNKVEEVGKVVFFPTREEDGSIDACLALPTQVMDILEIDPAFL